MLFPQVTFYYLNQLNNALCEWNSSQRNKVCVSACRAFEIKRWSPILGFNFWAAENGVEMVSETKSKEESSFHTLWTQHGKRLSFHLSFLTHAGSGSCWKQHFSCNRIANPPMPGDLTQRGHSAEIFLLFSSPWLVLCFLFLKVGTIAFISFVKLWDLSAGFWYHYSWGVYSLTDLS